MRPPTTTKENVFADRSSKPVRSEVVVEGSSSSLREKRGDFLPCSCTKCTFQYPLRLMFPKYASLSTCQWIYPVNYGGGLVEGDAVEVDITARRQCCALFTSQSFQRVYACSNKTSSQTFNYTIEDGSLLAVLPDPVLCYKDAIYKQIQTAHVQRGSNIVLLDWLTSGRTARGESWDFTRLQSKVSIYVDEELIVQENVDLSDTPYLNLKEAMGSKNVLGTCVLIGPFLKTLCENIVRGLGRRNDCGQKPSQDTIFAASPVPGDLESTPTGCVVRFAANSTKEAYGVMTDLLRPLYPTLGGNPFESKY